VKVITQFDLSIVKKAYETLNNYRIITNSKLNNKKALVFFSSNGIYYPNTEDAVEKTIFESGRFEWRNTLPKNFEKIILLRDVYKTWYLKGINLQIDSIDKLQEFLKQELEGFTIQTAGVSSGGYGSVLFALLLNASRAFSFAGQFSLHHLLNNPEDIAYNPYLYQQCQNPNYSKFYDLRPLMANSTTEIFYFLPQESEIDRYQASLVQNFPKVHTIAIRSQEHSVNLLRPCLKNIFNLSSQYLIKLSQSSYLQSYTPIQLDRRIGQPWQLWPYLLRKRRDLLPLYVKDAFSPN